MVPVMGLPLICYGIRHLQLAGVSEFVINTHHHPEAYDPFFKVRNQEGSYLDAPVRFVHEPVLLDTGGGVANVESEFRGEPDFFLHNGDILADLDLRLLLAAHRRDGNDVTLGLRSWGGPRHILWDPDSGDICDIRQQLGNGRHGLDMLYTGICVMSPGIFRYVEKGSPNPLIPAWLRMIRDGLKVRGAPLEDGFWMDLGTPDAYRQVHGLLIGGQPLSYFPPGQTATWCEPGVNLPSSVQLQSWNYLGEGATVGDGAHLCETILWPGAECASRIRLDQCIVRGFAGRTASQSII